MLKTLSPIISIILALAIFFFFTKPMFAEVATIQEQTNEYSEAVQKAEEFNNYLQGLLAKRNSFSAAELERLEALVPDKIDEVRMLVDLNALTDAKGVLFGNIVVEESDDKQDTEGDDDSYSSISQEDFNSLDISFSVIGTYDQMKDLLEDIEKSLILMEVLGMDFQSIEGDLQQYNMKVRLYSLSPTF